MCSEAHIDVELPAELSSQHMVWLEPTCAVPELVDGYAPSSSHCTCVACPDKLTETQGFDSNLFARVPHPHPLPTCTGLFQLFFVAYVWLLSRYSLSAPDGVDAGCRSLGASACGGCHGVFRPSHAGSCGSIAARPYRVVGDAVGSVRWQLGDCTDCRASFEAARTKAA